MSWLWPALIALLVLFTGIVALFCMWRGKIRENDALRAENAGLQKANGILLDANRFFAGLEDRRGQTPEQKAAELAAHLDDLYKRCGER